MGDTKVEVPFLDNTIGLVGEFIKMAFGQAVSEFGEGLRDHVKLWRLKNQITIIEKAACIAKEAGLKTKQINYKALAPLLEGIGLEEEPTLQNMWANLLVNYVDANKNLTFVVYPDILRQLSTEEVNILKRASDEHGRVWTRGTVSSQYTQLASEIINNLERLGLISDELDIKVKMKKDRYSSEDKFNPVVEQQPSNKFELTHFCYNFLDACNREEK